MDGVTGGGSGGGGWQLNGLGVVKSLWHRIVVMLVKNLQNASFSPPSPPLSLSLICTKSENLKERYI